MRDAQQINSTVSEYHEAKRNERRRYLAQVLKDLERARETGAEWYRWIVEEWRPRRLGERP